MLHFASNTPTQQIFLKLDQIGAIYVDLREASKKDGPLQYFGCFPGVWSVGRKIGKCFLLMTPSTQIGLICP